MCRSLSPSPATARSSLAPPHLFNSQSRTRSPRPVSSAHAPCMHWVESAGIAERAGGRRHLWARRQPLVTSQSPNPFDTPAVPAPANEAAQQAPARRPRSRRATINHAIAVLTACSARLLLLLPSSPLPTCPVNGILSNDSEFRELP